MVTYYLLITIATMKMSIIKLLTTAVAAGAIFVTIPSTAQRSCQTMVHGQSMLAWA